MNRIVYDGLQIAGLALATAGTWVSYGLGAAAMVAGAGLVVIPMLELHLFRR